jgi:hypothetical protein
MAIVKDEEQQQGQGTSQALGQGMAGQPQQSQQPQEQEQPQQGSSAPATIGASQPAQPLMPMPKQPKAGTGTFSNLRNYLQAAQGGGQQRVAQAATQQVQRLGAGAQKGTQQAQKAFETRMQAGSGAVFQGAKPGEYLTTEQASEQARTRASDIIGAARGTTYQAPQLQTQYNASKESLATATSNLDKANKQIEDFSKETRGPGGLFDPKRLALLKESAIPLQEQVSKAQAEFSPIEEQYKTQLQSQQYFTPEQTQRFAEIINAQYQGPASLQQAGLYEQAAQKARTAQEAAQKTQTALGREQLLKDVFGRTRDYGRGVSKLDALLLNASQQGVKQLQEQAQPAAQAQEALQTAQNVSANEAAQRQAAIEGIRSGARQEFTGAREAEELAVETRLSQVVDNWDQLPEYFKQVLRDKEKGEMALTEQEAGLLGIQAGQGLYNLTPEELVQTNIAEKARLISKNELSRQLALQQLAGADVSRELQKDLLYTDLEKAGTQTAEDAINRKAVQDVLAAQEKAFRKQAAGQNIVGMGSKKHKTSGKRYYAQESANLKKLLEKAGYDFNADIGAGATGSVQTDKDAPELNRDIGQVNLGAATDPYSSNQSDLAKAGYGFFDTGTGGATAGLRTIGIDPVGAVTGALGGSGPSSRYAKNIAARNARRDLQKRVTQALEQSGFANRAAIADTKQTEARQAALQEILAAREKLRG